MKEPAVMPPRDASPVTAPSEPAVQEPRWLSWAKKLRALAEQNLLYADSDYARERNNAILDVVADMIAHHTEADLAQVRPLLGTELGWPTPKVDVRAAIFNESGQLLMVRERDGGWSLPGGYPDVIETASEAVVREVAEETGLAVTVRHLLAMFDRSRHAHQPPFPYHVYIVVFECTADSNHKVRVPAGVGSAGEVSEIGWFAEDAIPAPLSLTRITHDEIAVVFGQHHNPHRPAYVD